MKHDDKGKGDENEKSEQLEKVEEEDMKNEMAGTLKEHEQQIG